MTDGKDTAAKTKPLISKENAQNRPETIQRGQVLGVSAFREQIGKAAVKRRWSLCPVCRNTSRENGRSFLMSVAGRNTTSFAGNAKGAASRASVPPLSNATLSIEKENKTMTDYPNNISAKLEIIKASEITPREVRWLWYPYIPFGKVTLLQGDPGDGKSKHIRLSTNSIES